MRRELKAIDYFRIPHNTIYLPSNFTVVLNTLGNMQYSQEHMKTITYANFLRKQSVLWGFENGEVNILLMKSYFSRFFFILTD